MTSNGNRRRPRLSDVAEAAGVSLGAASKALSAPQTVRPRTLAAVRAAVDRLGYIPSGAGRMLASRSTRMIGVALPSLHHPVYATFFHELQKRLADRDYLAVALSHEFDGAVEQALIERLLRAGVDGLVLIGTRHDPRTLALIDRLGLPHVFAWAGDEAPERDAVGFSDRAGMRQVIEHLALRGHRRIAMLNGDPRDNERAHWRLRGVEESAAAHGVALVDVATVPLTLAGGREGFALIDPAARGITALVCSTDLLAAGTLHAARSAGMAVPGALSVTGFDGIELAELLTPPLTTVHVPVADLARESADRIVGLLEGAGSLPSSLLPARLLVRASTGPASR